MSTAASDVADLVTGRRERLFAAMEDAGLDALVLGRPADVAYATGADALWTSGSRPFSPSCVVVGRELHLLATWDEGVPRDIPRANLYGLSWNPRIAADHVRSIEGLAAARRVGTDGTSVSFRRLAASAAPDAEVVDARDVLNTARSAKTTAEVRAVERACATAAAGLDAMATAATAGTTERGMLGRLAAHLGRAGTTVVPDEAVARVTDQGLRHAVSDRTLQAGDLVALTPSARVAGYEGTVGRTLVVDGDPTERQAALGRRCRAALDAVIAECVPGASGRELLDTWSAAGGGELPVPLAHGIGLGMETPVIGPGVGADERLADGSTLVVQAWLHDPGAGGWLERDVIHVTGDGPRPLTGGSEP